MKKGTFIVVVGPSAAGKTELVKALLKKIPNSARLVTSTTRERRPEEKPTDYFFVSREDFEKGIADDEFFEYADVYGNWYGSSKKVLEDFRQKYDCVFAVIDVQGAQTLKSKIPDARVVFINPGTVEQVEKRLARVRRDISPEELKKRHTKIAEELALAPTFDFVVPNADGQFLQALAALEAIVQQ